MSDTKHGIMLGQIGVMLEDYCLTSETTVKECTELLLLELEETKVKIKRLERENAILKRDNPVPIV